MVPAFNNQKGKYNTALSAFFTDLKIEAFSQNLLQQTGVKGQPDSGAQKPGPLREDSEQDTERLKVNTNVLYVAKIIKHKCFIIIIIMLNSTSFQFKKSSS